MDKAWLDEDPIAEEKRHLCRERVPSMSEGFGSYEGREIQMDEKGLTGGRLLEILHALHVLLNLLAVRVSTIFAVRKEKLDWAPNSA